MSVMERWKCENINKLVEQEASIDSIRIDREAELKNYSCLRFFASLCFSRLV